MNKQRLLCAGHSHMNCVVNSMTARQRNEPGFSDSLEYRIMQMRQEPYDPNFSYEGGVRRLSDNFVSAVAKTCEGFVPDAMLTMVNGQEFQVISIVRHPIPYDFAYPGDDEPLDKNAHIIPYAVIRAQLQNLTYIGVTLFQQHFRSLFDCPIYQIVPPPPVEDEAHILAFPGPFAEKAANNGLSRPSFRRKMWRLYREILREEGDKVGVITLDPPEGAVIDGYFAQKYWPNDPIHGNIAYGRAVFDMVTGLMAQETNLKAVAS